VAREILQRAEQPIHPHPSSSFSVVIKIFTNMYSTVRTKSYPGLIHSGPSIQLPDDAYLVGRSLLAIYGPII
jgi:hypothetical protein